MKCKVEHTENISFRVTTMRYKYMILRMQHKESQDCKNVRVVLIYFADSSSFDSKIWRVSLILYFKDLAHSVLVFGCAWPSRISLSRFWYHCSHCLDQYPRCKPLRTHVECFGHQDESDVCSQRPVLVVRSDWSLDKWKTYQIFPLPCKHRRSGQGHDH